jgi:aminoglycoside/choline kinase family phosphotransferase
LSAELSRFTQFEDWCLECARALGVKGDITLDSVSGDASFRSYFRFGDASKSYVAVNSPPDKEKNIEFVTLAKLMGDGGVKVPAVIYFDEAMGFMLLDDFGDTLLLPKLTATTADAHYQQVIKSLLDIQQLEHSYGDNFQLANYDTKLLIDEMNLFKQWFVGEMLGYALSEQELVLIDQVFERLVSSAQQQPQVFVHRDFHARNLMVLDGNEIGVIDFQDAVIGPITYDLVSLYKDCYICWPRYKVQQWVEEYRQLAVDQLNLPVASSDSFLKQFDLMGLQRHLKVLGIFARLSLRDGKTGYLKDLPLVLAYVRETCQQYSEFAAFDEWFEASLQPLLAKQDWYKPEGQV